MLLWLLTAMPLAASGDGWSNLKHITRDRLYVVVLRSGGCEYGSFSSIGDGALVLGTNPGIGLAIRRMQIVRVSDDLTAPTRGAVFSGRSSWADVAAASPKPNEYLRIVTKRGDELKWKQPVISEHAISSEGATIAKADIRYVFHVRAKPLNVDEEYLHQEDLRWLASIPWVGDLVPGKIGVMLYDSEEIEDNTPIRCR